VAHRPAAEFYDFQPGDPVELVYRGPLRAEGFFGYMTGRVHERAPDVMSVKIPSDGGGRLFLFLIKDGQWIADSYHNGGWVPLSPTSSRS
jgi:hypothetical protein